MLGPGAQSGGTHINCYHIYVFSCGGENHEICYVFFSFVDGMQEGSLACALWYRRAARFDVGERRRQPACQKSMKQTVQVGWGVDYGERSPTSLLMYGRRKSEGDPYVSQCCEITLILYAETALGTDATRVRACTFVSRPMTILNQIPFSSWSSL